MAETGSEHYVYKKDGEGSTYCVGEIVFENNIVQHDPCFINVRNTLLELPRFLTRVDDVWIISYPKSGTHWLNEIITLLTRNTTAKPVTDKDQAFLELKGQTEYMESLTSPRIFNTHLQLKFMSKHILDNAKIVFPLRNPKSVAVSYFHHRSNLVKTDYHGTLNGFLPDFIQGMESLYGNWFEMVISYWEYLKNKPNVHFVVYEDLIKKPTEGIKQISDFLGLHHDLTYCQYVAEQTRFESMRNREQEVLPTCTHLKTQEGFLRKGSTTDWKTHFTVAQNEMFNAVYEGKMKDYPDLKEKIKFE